MANQKVMQAWVKALRSGEYTQCTGALSRNGGEDGFCCLGVLTDLAVKQPTLGETELPTMTWNANPIVDHLEWTSTKTEIQRRESAMPPHVINEWAGAEHGWTVDSKHTGLSPNELEYGISDDGRVSLAWLNDEKGFTFSQIADAIEGEYVNA